LKTKSIVRGKGKTFTLHGVTNGNAGIYSNNFSGKRKGKKKKTKNKKNDKGGYFHAWGWKPTKKSKKQAEYRRKLAAQYNKKIAGSSIFIPDDQCA
jgi:hypothetical protein